MELLQVCVLTLRVEPGRGGFDDAELVTFLGPREALSVSEHFYVVDGLPPICLVVQYREPAPEAAPREGAGAPAVEVPAEHQALDVALRKWRNEVARREGKPG